MVSGQKKERGLPTQKQKCKVKKIWSQVFFRGGVRVRGSNIAGSTPAAPTLSVQRLLGAQTATLTCSLQGPPSILCLSPHPGPSYVRGRQSPFMCVPAPGCEGKHLHSPLTSAVRGRNQSELRQPGIEVQKVGHNDVILKSRTAGPSA